MSLRTVAARSQLGLVWLYSYLILAVSLFLWATQLAGSAPLASAGVVPWWVIGIGFMLTDRWVVHMHFRSEAGSFSFFEIPLIMGALFADPGLLVPAVFLGTIASQLWNKRQPVKLAAVSCS